MAASAWGRRWSRPRNPWGRHDVTVQVRPDRDAALAIGRRLLDERVRASNRAGDAFFGRYAHAIAACAAAMADRFFAGGTLLVFGSGPHATDAQHNSVEFVHPVLPGCRALPALSLTSDMATVTGILQGEAAADVYAHQVRVLGRSGDIALAFAHAPVHASITRGLDAGTAAGMLTVALTSGADRAGGESVDFAFHVPSTDRSAAHELHLATYHMLWELVHIVLNHRGIGDAP
jgi:D-sedoheptulose 7-phosphate isomerase